MKRLSSIRPLLKLPTRIPSRDQIRRYSAFAGHRARTWFLRERKPALICLAAGFLVFSLIHWFGVGVDEVKIRVPVKWEPNSTRRHARRNSDSKEYTVLRTDPESVEVSIRGPKDAINDFFTKEEHKRVVMEIRPDLPSGESLQTTNRLSRFNVKGISERSIRVTGLSDKNVEVTFDKETTMDFPFEGPALTDTDMAFQAKPFPETTVVTLSGAASILNSLKGRKRLLRADPISLLGRTGDFETLVAIRPVDEAAEASLLRQGILRDPVRDSTGTIVTNIPVSVKLQDLYETRTLSGIPVLLAAQSGDGNRYVSAPETIEVSVRGPKSALQQIMDSTNLMAVVDCKDLRGTPTDAASVRLPVRIICDKRHERHVTITPSPDSVLVSVVPESAASVPALSPTAERTEVPAGEKAPGTSPANAAAGTSESPAAKPADKPSLAP